MSVINSGRLDRRGFLKTTAAGAIAATLPMGGALAAPKRGGHLRVGKGHGNTSDTLNPGQWTNGYVIAMTFAKDGHLTEVLADGTIGPEVAESWEASEDAATWRVKLRKGMTFHSGKPVTVEDVAASIHFHRGEDSTSAAGPLVASIDEITTEGDDTIIFKLSGGNADFPFILSDYHLAILPAKDDSIDWQSGDGCGAYVLKSFKPGISTNLERNPSHWRDSVGWFDSIEMLVLSDQNARTTALVSGEVEATDKLDLKTVDLLTRKPDLNIHSVAGPQYYSFAMDARQAPFDDNNVRQALKYGVNREEMVEKILFGYGSVGNDMPIGQNDAFYNAELEQTAYDPDKAKYYLKQAGLDSLKVDLSAADAAFAGAVDSAVLYQNSAKEAGIDINVVREPNDGYWSDVWMKKPFSAVYWGGRPVPDMMFSTAFACGAEWNDGFWCNERFDDLLITARAELDHDKRKDMYWEMQEIVSTDGSIVIPMFANYVFAANKQISMPEMVASNFDMDGERWAERWWFT